MRSATIKDVAERAKRLAEDGFARDQQRAVGACSARASACSARSPSSTTSPTRPRAACAARTLVRDRAGLRQPEPVLHHRRAERRAVGVPRDRLRPADPSLRFDFAEAGRRTAPNWCSARAWPGWCWRRRCPSSTELIARAGRAAAIQFVRIISARRGPAATAALRLRRRPRRRLRDHRAPDPARPPAHRLPVGRQRRTAPARSATRATRMR